MVPGLLTLMLVLMVQAGLAERRPPHCPLEAAERCALDLIGFEEYSFSVDSMHLLIEYADDRYFSLKCVTRNLTLDNSAMPRFETQLRVSKAQLRNCPAPRGSYGAVLQRLNVFVMDKLTLIGAGNLTSAHLAELGNVNVLQLIDVVLAPHTLAALTGLRKLSLDSVRLQPGELHQLPSSLEYLELTRVGADVTHDMLERLPKLVKVTLRDASNVSVALAGALRELAMEVPAARVPSELTSELRNLTVFGWAEPWPGPWTLCSLDRLVLSHVTANELPALWVSDCVNLRMLVVQGGPQLRVVHATSLRGARRLQELHLTWCALTALPAGLLDDAVELRVLDLYGNFLKELPSGLFLQMRSLQMVDLSRNQLSSDMYMSVKEMTSLSTLVFDQNNPNEPSPALNSSMPLISILALWQNNFKFTFP